MVFITVFTPVIKAQINSKLISSIQMVKLVVCGHIRIDSDHFGPITGNSPV